MPVSAADADAHSATPYEVESRTLCRQSAQVACLLSVVLVPTFALLDFAVYPDVAEAFLVMRVVCACFAALLLGLLQTPIGERHPRVLGLMVTLAVGGMIDMMTIFTGRDASPYYAGTNLVLAAVALLMPWRIGWSLATSILLVGGYALATIVTGPVTQPRTFASNLAFLSAMGLIAVVSTGLRERLRACEFAARRALGETLQHKSDFMAKMSHELRTPLHVMIGYADILLEDALAAGGPQAFELVERVRGRGVQLHAMICDLLDLAKVDAGKMDLRRATVRPAELAERLVDGFRPLVDRKGLRLRLSCDDALPELWTDAQRLEQILTNLVGNAIKFTERGGIQLEVRAVAAGTDAVLTGLTVLGEAPARGRGTTGGRQLAFLVRDTGLGIGAADLARLADDFQQVNGTAERYGGTGLGLSISRRLARLLGGRLAVQSRPAEGSTFALLLPVETPPPARAAA